MYGRTIGQSYWPVHGPQAYGVPEAFAMPFFFCNKIGGVSLIHLRGRQHSACRFRSIVHVPHSAPKGASVGLYFGALAVAWQKKIMQGIRQSILSHCCSLANLGHQWMTKANLIVLWLLYKSVNLILATGSLLDIELIIYHDQPMPWLFEETCQPDRGRRPRDT